MIIKSEYSTLEASAIQQPWNYLDQLSALYFIWNIGMPFFLPLWGNINNETKRIFNNLFVVLFCFSHFWMFSLGWACFFFSWFHIVIFQYNLKILAIRKPKNLSGYAIPLFLGGTEISCVKWDLFINSHWNYEPICYLLCILKKNFQKVLHFIMELSKYSLYPLTAQRKPKSPLHGMGLCWGCCCQN